MKVFNLKKSLTELTLGANILKFFNYLSKNHQGQLILEKVVLVDDDGTEYEIIGTPESSLSDRKELRNSKNEIISNYYKFSKNNNKKINYVIVYYKIK